MCRRQMGPNPHQPAPRGPRRLLIVICDEDTDSDEVMKPCEETGFEFCYGLREWKVRLE